MVVKIKLPKLSSCGFSHENPEVFAMSQWQTKPKSIIYLMYRWVFAVFFACVLIYSMTSSAQDDFIAYWFIYLTNIGIFLCTIYSLYGAIFVSLYHFDLITLESTSFSYMIFWFLSNCTITLALMITIVYWVTLFDWSAGKVTLLDLLVHAINSVAMIIDLLIVLHPMYFFHLIYTVSVGLLYLIFTVIYYFAGGTDMWGNRYIYSILNWGKPGQTGLVVLAVAALVIILHCFACLIQFGRMKLHKLITKNRHNSFDLNKPV